MQMNIEIKRRPRALHEGHDAGSCAGGALQTRPLNQAGFYGPDDDRQATAERVGPAGEEQAQGPGERKNPLADQDIGDDG